jgi:hypothetical protein
MFVAMFAVYACNIRPFIASSLLSPADYGEIVCA